MTREEIERLEFSQDGMCPVSWCAARTGGEIRHASNCPVGLLAAALKEAQARGTPIEIIRERDRLQRELEEARGRLNQLRGTDLMHEQDAHKITSDRLQRERDESKRLREALEKARDFNERYGTGWSTAFRSEVDRALAGGKDDG